MQSLLEEAAGGGRLRASRPGLRERQPLAGQLGFEQTQGLPVVDVVPARHIDDRHADLGSALASSGDGRRGVLQGISANTRACGRDRPISV